MPLHDTTLVWFRRDLRIRDNSALRSATQKSRQIIPIFIFAPDEEEEWASGAASRWWLHHSLSALERELDARDSRLIIRQGPTIAVLQALVRETGASLLVWSRLYEPALAERDRAVGAALSSAVRIEVHEGNVLLEPGSIRNGQGAPYKVFTAFWRTASAQLEAIPLPLAAPKRIASPTKFPKSLPLDALRLLPRIAWDAGLRQSWTPGEPGALAQLRTFRNIADRYESQRNRPDEFGTSRLSPHLHFGEVTPRQIFAKLSLAPTTDRSLATYARELGWREFAHHLLHDFPDTALRPLDQRFERMRWSRRRSTLDAWRRGMTGYPIVDAGMRELWHTGWMHNRVRMIVASFLTKNLRHHWLEGARWFWDTLVDADLANNTLGWQWTAGCGADAAPYYRIFNPLLQAERFDPRRDYLRRWLPEIAALPDRYIHRPWDAPAAVLADAQVQLGKTYPRPIVSLARSRAAAMEAYRQIQRS